mgnify:CR=1 FL=1
MLWSCAQAGARIDAYHRTILYAIQDSIILSVPKDAVWQHHIAISPFNWTAFLLLYMEKDRKNCNAWFEVISKTHGGTIWEI